MTKALSESPSRIHYLDFGRFFAALVVALFHFNLQKPNVDQGVLSVGHLGVQFFFLISGFVIARSVENTQFVPFLIKRFIRLAPTYWAATIILGLIKLKLGAHADHPLTVTDFLGNLTFLSLTPFAKILHCDHLVVLPMWTIGYEIYFYLLIAIASLFKNGRSFFMGGWLIISAIETFRPGIATQPEYILRVATMYEVAPFFAGGYFLWEWYQHRKLSTPSAALLALCFIISLKHCYQLAIQMSGWIAPAGEVPGIGQLRGARPIDVALVVAFWIFFLIVILTKNAHRNQQPKTLKLELLLGALSYPIYLFHPLFNSSITKLTDKLHSKDIAMAISVIGTTVIAYLVVTYFERPLQRLMKVKLLPKREAREPQNLPEPEPAPS